MTVEGMSDTDNTIRVQRHTAVILSFPCGITAYSPIVTYVCDDCVDGVDGIGDATSKYMFRLAASVCWLCSD